MKQLLFVILLFSSPFLLAQGIAGIVKNAQTYEVLQGASVQISRAKFSAVTDEKGYFHTNKLVPKQYTIIVSYVGFLVYEIG